MYPFAIINFAGGGPTPGEQGLKALVKGGNSYFALGHNGDLYVMGDATGNGLGKTGTTFNPSTGGWTITNTGVDEIYGNLNMGALIKKGGQFYVTGYQNAFPINTADEQNDWRLLPDTFYTVGGYNTFDNIVQFYQGFFLCGNGNVYTHTATGVTQVTTVPAGGIKYIHVSNDSDNKIVITNAGAVYAQGYNGQGKAIDATGTVSTSWLGSTWKQVRDCSSGFEEAYTLQSRRKNGANTVMDRYNLILARKADGSWWVSGTQNTGLGDASTTVNTMAASTIPNLSKIIVGEAYCYAWTSVDNNWYVNHQIFVENETLAVHQSTGDQGTCYSLANGTSPTTNSTTLKNIAQALIDEGGIQMVVPHAMADRCRQNFILTKSGKLYLSGQGIADPSTWPAGVPQTAFNDRTSPGSNLAGPFPMPDFG